MNLTPFYFPVAAADWFEIAFFLFIVISSLIGQIIKTAQDRKRAGKPRPQKPPQPRPPADAPAKPDSLEAEIEQFLRKAKGRPERRPVDPRRERQAADAALGEQRRPPIRAEQVGPRGDQEPPVRARVAKRPRPIPRAEPPPAPAFELGESVAEHVEQHLRTGGVADRDTRLSQRVAMSDERIETRLHDVFDHKLGKLGQQTTASQIMEGTDAAAWEAEDQELSPLAAQIRRMLSSPDQVGTAIVLAEILRRPEERWDDRS